MHKGVLVGAALGLVIASGAFACGSSSSAPQGTHSGSSSGGSGGGSGSGGGGGEGLDGGVRMIPGFTGVVPCSQAIDAGGAAFGDCELSMPVSGGLSGTINVPEVAVVCGSGGPSTGTGIGEIDWGTAIGQGTSVSASVTFENGVPFDMTGTFPAHVEIAETFGDGGSLRWATPAGGCSIVIAGSQCDAAGKGFDGGPRYSRVLSGTGTCSQAAAPETGTNAAPVTIGSFAFVETVAL